MDTGLPPTREFVPAWDILRDGGFMRRSRRRAARLDDLPALAPAEDVAELAAAGLLTAPLPRALGGRGWGTEASGAAAAMEALRLIGRIGLPLGRLYEGHMNAVRLAIRFGRADQRSELRDMLEQGQLFGVWNTEAAETPLIAADGRFQGGKILCSGIGLVEQALVTSRPAGGGPQQMWLVPVRREDPRGDVEHWTPSGMRASATGRIDLTGISFADCLCLGGPDDYQAQPDFSAGAWRFLAVQLGGIEAVAEALRQDLLATGRGEDPHQAARLGRVLTAAETARLWVGQACAMAEQGPAAPDAIMAYVDLARGAVETAALEVMELSKRSIGLRAFMEEHPIERMVRDLETYLRQPGPDRALVAGAAFGLKAPDPVGDQWP